MQIQLAGGRRYCGLLEITKPHAAVLQLPVIDPGMTCTCYRTEQQVKDAAMHGGC